MIAAQATYEATTMEMVAARTESELRRAPRRLALWRLAMLDWVLRQLEEVRLSGDRVLPAELRSRISIFAACYDPVLSEEMAGAAANDLDRLHEAVFDAQGRVMTELSELRRTPSWRELERLFSGQDCQDQGG